LPARDFRRDVITVRELSGIHKDKDPPSMCGNDPSWPAKHVSSVSGSRRFPAMPYTICSFAGSSGDGTQRPIPPGRSFFGQTGAKQGLQGKRALQIEPGNSGRGRLT